MYTVYRCWKDGFKEHLLVLLSLQEAEERCLLLNNQRLPWSHSEYQYIYMYEAITL